MAIHDKGYGLMKKCEPWAIAAVYLMESSNEKEHYTKIVNYIFETQLTDLVEKSVAASHTINKILDEKVIDGRAVFQSYGNGYFSLVDKDAMRSSKAVQDVIQCLTGQNPPASVPKPVEKKIDLMNADEIPDEENEKLSDEARKFYEDSRRLSDEARKLSDETQKLSDETRKLRSENKNLREETKRLQQEKRQLNMIKSSCD